MRLEKWVDEIVPMADGAIGEDMHIVTATRNAIDVRKWVASKLMPNQYGDQPTSGVTINNQTNVVVMSDERLRQLQETRRRMMLDAQGAHEA